MSLAAYNATNGAFIASATAIGAYAVAHSIGVASQKVASLASTIGHASACIAGTLGAVSVLTPPTPPHPMFNRLPNVLVEKTLKELPDKTMITFLRNHPNNSMVQAAARGPLIRKKLCDAIKMRAQIASLKNFLLLACDAVYIGSIPGALGALSDRTTNRILLSAGILRTMDQLQAVPLAPAATLPTKLICCLFLLMLNAGDTLPSKTHVLGMSMLMQSPKLFAPINQQPNYQTGLKIGSVLSLIGSKLFMQGIPATFGTLGGRDQLLKMAGANYLSAHAGTKMNANNVKLAMKGALAATSCLLTMNQMLGAPLSTNVPNPLINCISFAIGTCLS